MKRLAVYILTVWLLLQPVPGMENPGGQESLAVSRWIIQSNSGISIEGKSNINSFICDVNEYLQPDTVTWLNADSRDAVNTLQGVVSIDINRFDCHQRFITSDFRKTLKACEGSKLKVQLLSIDKLPAGTNAGNVSGWVDIDLAGVKRRMQVSYLVKPMGANQLELDGSRNLLFSDFNLVPPSRLAGLIKIEQEIRVKFRLCLRQL